MRESLGRMDELFRNVRESATPAVWSKGVELSRQDAVTGDRETADEILLRVQGRDVTVSQSVTLFPEDGDWSCSCAGDEDPCAHVAAAVIALKRAREQGTALPKAKVGGGRLVYVFTRTPTGLAFERAIEKGETRETLTVRLPAPAVAATAEDLEVELALGSDRRGVLPARVFPKLLKALARGLDVSLDGHPVAIDPAGVGLIAEVADDGPGVRVSARVDPAIKESFANGVALCETGLRPVVRPTLTPAETELLRDGRFFGSRDFGDLAASILPPLEDKLPVVVRTIRLPKRQSAKPRLELHLDPKGNDLEVSAAIVYGDPPLARVRLGRFDVLGDNVPVRDTDAERKLADQLSRDLRMSLDERRLLPPPEAVRLVEQLGRFPGDVLGKGLARFRPHPELTPTVSLGDDRFAVAFSSQGKSADPARVLEAFAAGETLVPLLDGGYAPLPASWLRLHGEKVADLLAARRENGTVPRTAALMMADLADDLGEAVPSPLRDLRERLAHFQNLPPFQAPAGLRAELRHYQQDGVRWLAYLKSERFGALLADDMGLGKTLQAITVLSGKSLVVCPTSVLQNWQRELARFRPNLRVEVYHGPGRVLEPAADVILTTYAVLRLDADALAALPRDVVVLDEAQMIKNPQSQAFKAASRLPGTFRVALSGTPVENRLEELWALMQFLNPGLLGDLASFKERFARRIAAADAIAAERLRRLVRPFLLRRMKREVAPELPPRTEVVRHVELSAAERTQYDVVRAAARKDVVAKLGQGAGMLDALEALLRLRQACCHAALLPGGTAESSSKLELLTSLVAEAAAEGHKTLVFSQWTSLLDLCEPAFRAAGLTFTRLDGTTKDRGAVVDAFQADGGPSVLLLSLKAGGVGLNLTAADHVVILDPWWNPAAEDQAADRAHRIGQDKPVLVQRLVALDTVEEKILALQEKKRELAAVAFGQGAGASLSRDDLLALLD